VVRRYDDTIDVRLQDVAVQGVSARGVSVGDISLGDVRLTEVAEDRGGTAGSQPAAFVWRGRLYVVRAVQTRWYERRAWWREAAAAALLGLRGDEQQDGQRGTAGGGPAPDVPAGADPLDGETEVWRVEAAAGRSGPVGVFDLARSVPTTPGAAPGGWRLTRVAD
jgi:Family of unknown function (DUF6504)